MHSCNHAKTSFARRVSGRRILAHGFKTPLQILSGDVLRLRERGEESVAKDIEAIILRMRRHVDHEMARARQAERGHAGRSDLGRVASQVVSVVARTPAGRDLDWQQEIEPGLILRIDPRISQKS
jgi:hypothetical protein